MNAFKRVAAAVVFLSLSACAHSTRVASKGEARHEYVVGREDVLDISVWRDADLSRTVPVRPDGKISLPLLGELDVAGKTTNQIAQEIKAGLNGYVQDPKVVVILREVNSPRFFVIGEVTKPGGYPLRGRMTVLQALSIAGGFNEWADKGAIVVMRDGNERVEVDYAALVKPDGEKEKNFPLNPGDTIYVP